jgi:23S rRNA pseudouridine1911/1915/1917 synthase
MPSITDYILYQDRHIVVANKPSSVGVLPSYIGGGSFVQILSAHCNQPLICVHRIDVPVSGVIVLAKSKKVATHLGHQFKERTVKKTYLAISRFDQEEHQGSWKDLILKHRKGNKSGLVEEHEKAKEARAGFEYLEGLEHIHLWKLFPKTGRHHQLRVQMSAHIGPIRGDQKYGDKRGNKDRSIDLHAYEITFIHPDTEKEVTFIAPPPPKSPWTHFKSLQKHYQHVG